MENCFNFTAELVDEEKRIDLFLQERMPQYSRSALQKLILDGFVLVKGKIVQKNYRLSAGETVSLSVPAPRELNYQARKYFA